MADYNSYVSFANDFLLGFPLVSAIIAQCVECLIVIQNIKAQFLLEIKFVNGNISIHARWDDRPLEDYFEKADPYTAFKLTALQVPA
jgi:hypothetical protein